MENPYFVHLEEHCTLQPCSSNHLFPLRIKNKVWRSFSVRKTEDFPASEARYFGFGRTLRTWSQVDSRNMEFLRTMGGERGSISTWTSTHSEFRKLIRLSPTLLRMIDRRYHAPDLNSVEENTVIMWTCSMRHPEGVLRYLSAATKEYAVLPIHDYKSMGSDRWFITISLKFQMSKRAPFRTAAFYDAFEVRTLL